jgi:hypothetical protein
MSRTSSKTWRARSPSRGDSKSDCEGGWAATIIEQRLQVAELLTDSPSLRRELLQKFAAAHTNAVKIAGKETGSSFPEPPPFTLEQVLDEGFWPEA